jgi:hypothetical protein
VTTWSWLAWGRGRAGTSPSAKLGDRGGFRFKRDDLDRFLDSRRPHDA